MIGRQKLMLNGGIADGTTPKKLQKSTQYQQRSLKLMKKAPTTKREGTTKDIIGYEASKSFLFHDRIFLPK